MDSWFKKDDRFPCPPDMNEIRKNINALADKYEDTDVKQAREVTSCVENYLNLYNLFTTGKPPEDTLIRELYNKTKELIEGAEESRWIQKEIVEYKVEDYRDRYDEKCKGLNDYEYCDELKAAIEQGESVLEGFGDDFQLLEDLKYWCSKANSKPEMTVCIERFVNASHERGPYIPLGCGGYLPELLSEELEGEPESLMERMTSEIEDETQRVLDCLKDYKG